MPIKALLVTAAALAALPALAQAQSAPPVKMGLWQTTTVSSMTGLQLPPEVVERMKAAGREVPGMAPSTSVSQSCLTPEKWQKAWQRMQQGQSCEARNLKQDASGMSVDLDCKTARGATTGHMKMDFISPEKAHGTMHMEIASGRSPQPMIMNITMDSVYQGADCKGVSPDEARVTSH